MCELPRLYDPYGHKYLTYELTVTAECDSSHHLSENESHIILGEGGGKYFIDSWEEGGDFTISVILSKNFFDYFKEPLITIKGHNFEMVSNKGQLISMI